MAYFSFFLLIFRSTKGARHFEDLILHKQVPELVYLQTRKLLRDTHFTRAEQRRTEYLKDGTTGSRSKSQTMRDGSDSEDNEAEVSKSKRNKSISFNPNLQSYRDLGHSSDSKVQPFIDESQRFMEEVSFEKKAEKIKAQTTRLSMSTHEIEMRKKDEKG